jgi:hypothetical protein
MRFPLQDKLALPCVFERLVPGRQHPDGRRYLPLIVLRPTAAGAPAAPLLGVVDRHHRVREAHVGRAGSARLVCALSTLRLQAGPPRLGLEPEPGRQPDGPSLAPLVYGRVLEVAAWEIGAGELPYERVYAELLLDIGLGLVGVRTSLTAASLAAELGKARVELGDQIELARSRIDILAFEPELTSRPSSA